MIIPVFIPQQGCPHQCVFCNQETISGQKVLGLTAAKEQIIKYVQWLKSGEENEMAFYGGTFTGLPLEEQKELLSLATQYRDKGIISSIRLSTRPDYINKEIIELLQSYKVTTVELGTQSLDNEVLQASGRGHNAEDVIKAFRALKEAGFTVGLQLMVGLPKQSFDSFKATVATTVQLKPDLVRIYPLLVIKNTPLAKMYEMGTYLPLTLEEAVKESSYAYELFREHNINVIRMGLQPDDELCAPGNIIAGPFHPSFGELVKSYGYRMKVQSYIDNLPKGVKKITVIHTPKEASVVRGLNKSNVAFWEKDNIEVSFEVGDKFYIKAEK